ncbi:MAG: hypothetical protein IMZ57_04210 [Acidobacteria bacterium]|nr:hypothetical protein [Acidobacteriota bacterium]
MSMTIDFSDFEKGLTKLVKQSEPKATAEGLFQAGSRLIIDAKEMKPYVPWKEGTLSGSGRTDPANVTRDGAEVTVGFNKEYAARWHELSPEEDAKINWTLPFSGRKYLESKMAMFKDKYMKIVATYLAKVLGGSNV